MYVYIFDFQDHIAVVHRGQARYIFFIEHFEKKIGTTFHQNNFHLYKYHRYVCSVCGKEHGYYKALKHCQDRHKGRFMHPCTLCDKKYLDKV